MAAFRHAVLTYGLVNVPVGIATAAASSSITFKGLHRANPETGEVCHHPAKQHYHCDVCGVDVGPDDKVSGYPVTKGLYVTFEKEELDALKAERSPVIQLEQFVRLAEIDPIYFEKQYYLLPPDSAAIAKAYKLLMQTMAKEKMAGVGRASLWGKEHPCAVYAKDGLLMFTHLFSTSEIREEPKARQVLEGVTLSQPETKLARELVRAQTVPFNPDAVESLSEARLQEAIDAKWNGELLEVREPEPMPEPTVDLLSALRASMEAAETPKPKRKAKAKV